MKLYFSNGIGDRLAIRKNLLDLARNPTAEFIISDEKSVKFGKKVIQIDDLNERIPCIFNRKLIPGLKGGKFHLVLCQSPDEIVNLRPSSAECVLSPDHYILPNGKIYLHATNVINWVRKWGKDKLEFNYKSFIEAKRMAKDKEFKIKKPKGKSKNPFFDSRVLNGLKKDKTVQNTGLVAIERKSEVVQSALYCDTCQFRQNCPGFMASSVCLYSNSFKYLANKIKSRDIDLIIEAIQDVIADESERYNMAKHFEKVSGIIDGRTTQIGDLLFRKLVDFVKLVKPELNQEVTYNILNQQVNISTAVEKLEDAGLSKKQRTGLAEQVDKIIKEEKQKGTPRTKVVAT